MKRYKNLTIIGTSHISIQSIKEVKEVILKEKPEIVAIELDKSRFITLMNNKREKLKLKDIFHIGLKGYLFNLAGAWIENKIGNLVGVSPGSEMKIAVITARSIKSSIVLIDQDIRVTLKRLSNGITWKERFRFFNELIISLLFKRKQKFPFDLKKVPEEKIIKKITLQMKERYPSIYRVLIKERNDIMAKRLYTLMTNKKSIVAIIGAGHESDIISLINQCYQKLDSQKKK